MSPVAPQAKRWPILVTNLRLLVLFTSIIIHWLAPDDRSTSIDNNAASRPSSPRTSRDINMRSLSINREARFSQSPPLFFEDAFSWTRSNAASEATGHRCQKMLSGPTELEHGGKPGGASTLFDGRAALTGGLNRAASYNHASTHTGERNTVESSSLADRDHLRSPGPALLNWP